MQCKCKCKIIYKTVEFPIKIGNFLLKLFFNNLTFEFGHNKNEIKLYFIQPLFSLKNATFVVHWMRRKFMRNRQKKMENKLTNNSNNIEGKKTTKIG